MQTGSRQAYIAELLGTMAIVAAVTGAGFMTEFLSSGYALGLTMIALTVAAVLFVAISTLGPISGAHFNPVVTIAFLVRGEISPRAAASYLGFQLLGAVAGAGATSLMFERNIAAISTLDRFSSGTFFGEVVATAGLVMLIVILVTNSRANLIAGSVAAWIFAGHIFTSSTSFANPAVTIGRIFTEAPSGISVDSALWFTIAQLVGLGLALLLIASLKPKEKAK